MVWPEFAPPSPRLAPLQAPAAPVTDAPLHRPAVSAHLPADPAQTPSVPTQPPTGSSVVIPDHPPPYWMKVTGLPTSYGRDTLRLFFEYGPDFYSVCRLRGSTCMMHPEADITHRKVASSFKQFQRARHNPSSFIQRQRRDFPPLRQDDLELSGFEAGSVGAKVRYHSREEAVRAMEAFPGKRLIARDGTCRAMQCTLL